MDILFITVVAIFIILLVSIRFLFIALDLLFNEVSIYRIHPVRGIIALLCYWLVMVLIFPYLIIVEYSPSLMDKWVHVHKSSIKRVFLT